MKQVTSFAKRLKSYRDDHSLSLAELEKITGVPAQTLNRYELGQRVPKIDVATAIAGKLNLNPLWLQGYDVPQDYISFIAQDTPISMVPVLGTIAAGAPILAAEHIEGYEPAPVSDPENYFYLIVKGDSMKGARIMEGDRVLVRKQNCADNGQIVVCLVNGEEATVKRFRELRDMIILQPENSAYEPMIVSKSDFGSGYAKILGIVTSVQFNT
jgi:repressor LexA